jgi:hypothetical protein
MSHRLGRQEELEEGETVIDRSRISTRFRTATIAATGFVG